MNTKHLILTATAVALLSACHDKRPQPPSATQLIEAADHFQIDTIAQEPQDTLYSEEVGSVLRHYPELYHAARKASKTYAKWTEQARLSALAEPTELLSLSPMLEETLLDTSGESTDAWPSLAATDSLYLQLLADAPTVDRKSAIGRARRAFLGYTEQLQQLSQALPEECRPRYAAVVARQAKAYHEQLKQQNQTK